MPPSRAILLPALALVALTAVVWVWMYVVRLTEIRQRRLDPQALARARDASQLLESVSAADNLRNLFEIPVLFYAFCAFTAITGLASTAFVTAAWTYVALRAIHSLIHVTYNRVTHRFVVYVVSTVLLFGMWAAFAARFVAQGT